MVRMRWGEDDISDRALRSPPPRYSAVSCNRSSALPVSNVSDDRQSSLQALRTATINPARYLGHESDMGNVEVGKLADMVLLDADPLADIRNTAKVNSVVLNGRFFDRKALDAILAGVEISVK